jgi:hypothetical protein
MTPAAARWLPRSTGVSGTRTVVHSVVVARGVFSVGRLVEISSQPGDPDNVSRDDLVFAEGTMQSGQHHGELLVLQNRGCHGKATLQQTNEVTGGTGQFAAATGHFTATVTGPAILARNPDGSCSFTQPALHEVDMFTVSGTLSF